MMQVCACIYTHSIIYLSSIPESNSRMHSIELPAAVVALVVFISFQYCSGNSYTKLSQHDEVLHTAVMCTLKLSYTLHVNYCAGKLSPLFRCYNTCVTHKSVHTCTNCICDVIRKCMVKLCGRVRHECINSSPILLFLDHRHSECSQDQV